VYGFNTQAVIKHQIVQSGDRLSVVLLIKNLRKFIFPHMESLPPLHKKLIWL
jgi:hypothetical protein